jgi:acetolactate synthase-1/2/3 large subunit
MKYLPITEERDAAQAVITALAEGGVKYVFGMPGGLTGALWRALYQHPAVRAVQVREESIGALMAEAYGRFTGRPAVVMGQGEWIAGNAGQGYMEALLGASPLIILTEMSDGASLSHHAPYQSGTGDYGTWDVRQSLAGVTKRLMVSHSPAQAVQHTQLALKHALTGEQGPVAVVYHSSALQGRVGPMSVPRIYSTEAYLPLPCRRVDHVAIASVADVIRGAARPVIVAGNGVRLARAQDSLARLARSINAPVATTASGKGVFAERDALAVGVIGPFGWPSANAVVADADVVLAVGTKLGPTDTANENPGLLDPTRQVLVQIDVEPLNASWTFPIDHVLVGDAGYVMDRLLEACDSQTGLPAADGTSRAERARVAYGRAAVARPALDDVPLAPRRIIEVLEEIVPDDAVVTCDAGENRLFMMQWFRTAPGGEYLQPAAGGGMGYAVPAAMAARLADADRPVVAVCGDGGFAMSIHALMTAVQENIPIAVLVFNNGALGWVLHGMGREAVAASFADFDHAEIARSLGCDGVRVATSDDLRMALKSVSGLSRPLVIDVPTSLATSFQDVAQTFDDFPRPASLER